jgi:hypothetical protein
MDAVQAMRRLVVLVSVAATIGLAVPTPAQADSNALTALLDALINEGVKYSVQTVVHAIVGSSVWEILPFVALTSCAQLDAGEGSSVVSKYVEYTTGFNDIETFVFLDVALGVFCPRNE